MIRGRKEHSCSYVFYLYKIFFKDCSFSLEKQKVDHFFGFSRKVKDCHCGKLTSKKKYFYFGHKNLSSKFSSVKSPIHKPKNLLHKGAEDKVVMFGLIVTEESNFVDKFLYQISKNSFFLIGCIYRNGQSYIPRGNWKIQKNDQLFVLFPKEKLQSFEKNFGVKTSYKKTVVIYGSNLLNSILVNSLLQENFIVTVICDHQEEKKNLEKDIQSLKNFKIIVGSVLDLAGFRQLQ